jgi:IclR family transcriptional regulator, acetate operon repressor
MAEVEAESGEGLVTVQRTMRVLEMLADSDVGMSLSDIAKELDVNKSIALRIVLTLEEMNYLYRHSESKRFYAGFKISNVGFRILVRTGLIDQCEPVLRRLAEQTGELVLFSVIDSDRPRWVMAATGPRRRLQVDPMTSMELHSTATGKAWLATLPDKTIAQVLKGRLRAVTPYTITTLAGIMQQVREIRATGFSFSNQENETGIAAVATAILQQQGEKTLCVGFVSITAPLARATPEDFVRYRDLLKEAARVMGDSWPLDTTANMTGTARSAYWPSKEQSGAV